MTAKNQFFLRLTLDITAGLQIFFKTGGPKLGPSINGLVTERNKKLRCRGFLLALFQSTTDYKIDSEHTQIIRGYSRCAKLKYYELQ